MAKLSKTRGRPTNIKLPGKRRPVIDSVVTRSNSPTPIPYYGAKLQQAANISRILPKHNIYVEPFCGSAALFSEKEPAKLSFLSDINPWVIDTLITFRDNWRGLIFSLPSSLSKERFLQEIDTINNNNLHDTPLENSVTMILGWGAAFNTSAYSKIMSEKMRDQLIRRINSGEMKTRAEKFSAKLKYAVIEKKDAVSQLTDLSGPGVLFFLDPPYLRQGDGGGSRGASYRGYGPYDTPPGLEWPSRLLDAIEQAADGGSSIIITIGDDHYYYSALEKLGFSKFGEFGVKGGEQGSGGIATAKHQMWGLIQNEDASIGDSLSKVDESALSLINDEESPIGSINRGNKNRPTCSEPNCSRISTGFVSSWICKNCEKILQPSVDSLSTTAIGCEQCSNNEWSSRVSFFYCPKHGPLYEHYRRK